MINNGLSPIKDTYIEDLIRANTIRISAIYNTKEYDEFDYIIIATPLQVIHISPKV